jgi:hypothetical protein
MINFIIKTTSAETFYLCLAAFRIKEIELIKFDVTAAVISCAKVPFLTQCIYDRLQKERNYNLFGIVCLIFITNNIQYTFYENWKTILIYNSALFPGFIK